MPNPIMVKNWCKRAPDNFRFTAKFPKVITHDKRLKNVEKELEYFLESISGVPYVANSLICSSGIILLIYIISHATFLSFSNATIRVHFQNRIIVSTHTCAMFF
jgi:hypothetical protein